MTDNITDLSQWPANKMPVSAEWATGHDIVWNADQIRAGRRLLPTFVLYSLAEATQKKVDSFVNPVASHFTYISDNHLPLILRHQSNLAADISDDRGTYPGNTLVEWRMVNGVLDSRPICDHLASPSLWAAKGAAYANGIVNARLKQLLSGCPWIGFFDNHETGHELGKVGSKAVGAQPNRQWMTAAELDGISLSLKDKVTALGFASDPFAYIPEIYEKQALQYGSLFGAFATALGKWVLSAAYSANGLGGATPQAMIDRVGPVPDALAFNAGGPSCYITGTSTDLLNNPNIADVANYTAGWEWMEYVEDERFRIVFVSIGEGATTGPHGLTTPDLFKAWCEWIAWLSRPKNGDGPAVLLQHWIGSSTKPTDPFGAFTHGDYSIAPAKACDSICQDVVRDYWTEGENVPSTVSHPQVRINAVRNGSKYLVFAWSPYVISEVDMPITVDGIPCTIRTPSAGVSYWEASPPTPTSLTGIRIQ